MLVVLEGLDGIGKTTQTRLLIENLCKKGHTVYTKDFPQYESSFFGKIIGKYLTGEFGDPVQVDPKYSSILYAGDRLEAKEELLEWTKDENAYIILNRYVPSNLAYNMAKYENEADRKEFVEFIENLEYNIHGIPRPDLVLYLDGNIKECESRINTKGDREYLKEANIKKDLYESNTSFQLRVRQCYLQLCKDREFTGNPWRKISSVSSDTSNTSNTSNTSILTPDEIQNKILKFF